jgi:hypothetical protein
MNNPSIGAGTAPVAKPMLHFLIRGPKRLAQDNHTYKSYYGTRVELNNVIFISTYLHTRANTMQEVRHLPAVNP